MLEKLLGPEIRELIAEHDDATLSEVLDRWLPADVAALLDDLPPTEELPAFQAIQGPQRVQTFEYLDRDTQLRLLEGLPPEEAGHVLNEMAADDRTALLEECEDDQANRWIALLSADQQAITRTLLDYPEESVGRVMTPDCIAVRQHWTLQHVLDYVRHHGKDSETLNVVYVVDSDHRLIDDIRIRQVLLASPRKTVHDLMDGNFIALSAKEAKRNAVELFRKYDRLALPVVNERGKLQGIVTIDDVLDIAEEAATEDMHRLGGLEALDEPYIDTPLMTMVQKRAIWLVVLFLGEMFTATAMGYFEAELNKAVVLSLFLPLIISSGGNSGSQAATLIVRALSLGEVTLRDWWRVMHREIWSGVMLGLILGVIGFLRISIWSLVSIYWFRHKCLTDPNSIAGGVVSQTWEFYSQHSIYKAHWLLVAATVGISLVGVVLWGTLSGSMLPFLLKKLGLDPATSSAPFVATLVDVTGLVIYFTVAMIVLHGTLL